MERVLVAKVGALVFAGVLTLPLALPPAGAQASSAVIVASAMAELPASAVTLDLPELATPVARSLSFLVASELAEALPPVVIAPGAAAPPPPEPLVLDGAVLASWYGPGFYGNRTACGQTFTPELVGVAHRTLPCGTQVAITSPAGITVVAPVIDRGPFVGGRSLDLSSALRVALRCSDLCRVRMIVAP